MTATNGCGMHNASLFYLQVVFCEDYEKPEPLTNYDILVLAEPGLPRVLYLSVTFLGDPNNEEYLTMWQFAGTMCLEEDPHTQTSHIHCSRTPLTQCSFNSTLRIKNPTHDDSNRYTVQAIGDDRGNMSTIELCT